MKLFGVVWIWTWGTLAYAQEVIDAANLAAPAGTALTLGGGDLTFPAALVVCTAMLSRWTPKVEIILTDKRP